MRCFLAAGLQVFAGHDQAVIFGAGVALAEIHGLLGFRQYVRHAPGVAADRDFGCEVVGE